MSAIKNTLLLITMSFCSTTLFAQDDMSAEPVAMNSSDAEQKILAKLSEIKNDVTDKWQIISEKPAIKQLKVDARASQPVEIKDPFERLNRKVFAVNNFVDEHAVRPLAVQYLRIVPDDVRAGYTGFRTNIREPWYATNQALQGRPKVAAKSFGRFLINTLTTFGLADVAKRKNLTSEKDDFGTTLGYWGVPTGPYLMLPGYGPSNFRDVAGQFVDSSLSTKKLIFEDDKAYWTNQAVDVINIRSQLFSAEELLQGDKYSAVRDAYLQQRSYTIATKKGIDFDEQLFSDADSEMTTDVGAEPEEQNAQPQAEATTKITHKTKKH
ncbi:MULTISPECIES: VacJ family lipoprotein [unclassified Acinetobacter]|uniref:MlaA family lipoprotein n=1 Tax=unclassified Acinetobacter TaxID=196816 RepID=UPI0035B8C352